MQIVVQEIFQRPVNWKDLAAEALVVHRRTTARANDDLFLFVHGLGGGRYSTWGRLTELAFEELPKSDAALYSYRTLAGRLKFWKSVAFDQEARTLAGLVRETEYPHIFLVGHSMGGLLIKAMVRELIITNQLDALSKVAGVMLMATPQAGSLRVPSFLSWLTVDTRALKAHGPLATETNQTFLDRLHMVEGDWRRDRTTVPVWAVEGSSDLWVDRLSAGLGLDSTRKLTVRGSHTSIVKPLTGDDDAYRFLRKCAVTAFEHARARVPDSVSNTADQGRIEPSGLPAPGVVIDRLQLLNDVRAFLEDRESRLMVIHGLRGIGKTVAVARAVEDRAGQFDGIGWIECRGSERTSDVFLARIDEMLRSKGDRTLHGVWSDPRLPLDAKIDALVRSLAGRYLIILDDFEDWLDQSLRLESDEIRRLLLRILSTAHNSKVLIISRARPWDVGPDQIPTGVSVEQELSGLSVDDSAELLGQMGVSNLPRAVTERICEHFGGNPALLKLFGRHVVSRHRGPEELLDRYAAASGFAPLLDEVLTGLPPEASRLLGRLSVYRLAPPRPGVGDPDAFPEEPLGTLIDRSLVLFDRATQRCLVAGFLRDRVVGRMTQAELTQAHEQAANDYARRRPQALRHFDDAVVLLEEGYHRLAAGDSSLAADRVADAAELLVGWGYLDKAEEECRQLLEAPLDQRNQARCYWLLALIDDLRGNYELALSSLAEVRRVVADQEEPELIARTHHLEGRVHNRQRRFDEARAAFDRCINMCEAFGLSQPLAAAHLDRAWADREEGTEMEVVEAGLETALGLAEESGDHATEVAAHRELAFLLALRHEPAPGPKEPEAIAARSHLERALDVALEQGLAKEMGGVYVTASYAHWVWDEPEQAEASARHAIDVAQTLGDPSLLASARANLSGALEQAGRTDAAIESYLEAITDFSDAGDMKSQAWAMHRLGLLEKKNGLPEAMDHLISALRIAETEGFEDLATRVRANLAE